MNGALRADIDIWMVERSPNGWGDPIHLGPQVNTTDATVPSASDVSLQDAWNSNPEGPVDGKTLPFTSLRPGGYGLGDLYVSDRV